MDWLFDSIGLFFLELLAPWFLLGVLFVVVGLFLVVALTYVRMTGVRIEGVIVGAFLQRRLKVKERDGERVEKKKETLFPVFEYEIDGQTRHALGSEGGTHTKRYSTGQSIQLIVHHGQDYDDVYDANSYGAFVVGGTLLLIGGGLIAMVGNAASFVGGGTLSLVFALGVLAFKFRSNTTKTIKNNVGQRRQFDMAQVKPVEEFA